ncbi:MAG: hypothetical protein U1C57_02480 [Candidatus Doudnabacteria bacterium]|nr:Trp family transcriptional regulator [bacterium]MDZ4243948.1 hypothetical protein [Candidatus Doudnabacteria bacterium]
MPRVSNYDLEDRRIKELVGQLWNAFTLLENRNEIKTFLSRFFTPTEIQMFAKRLELLKLADSDLEVTDLRRLLKISKVTIYEWFDKHDAYEEDFRIVTNRLREIERRRLKTLKERMEGLPKVPKRSSIGTELLKVGANLAYKGYKKRKKRQSVLKDVL